MPIIRVPIDEYYKADEVTKKRTKYVWMDVPYYKLVFKNDMVMTTEFKHNRVAFVFLVILSPKLKSYDNERSCFYEFGQMNESIEGYYLFKRPFKNWIKYLLVLITNRYIR